jgi:pseudaminic acid cytidylyltransferase
VNVAIIPARGGSKRIPRKNVREFCGKPIIGYSVDCAQRTGLFSRVVVSTDDEEIAGIARSFGAEVPFMRPGSLADDRTGTAEVMAHAVSWLIDSGTSLSAACCIYATAPLIQAGDLKQGLTLLESGDWQYVFSATAYAAPIFRAFRKNTDGGLSMFWAENYDVRSQDLPQALHDAAQFYWGRPQAWLSAARVFDSRSTVIEIPRWRVQDIDTEEDWIRAEALARSLAAVNLSPATHHSQDH